MMIDLIISLGTWHGGFNYSELFTDSANFIGNENTNSLKYPRIF